MRHLQQPARSLICGQTCVAMLSGVSIERALQACTRGRRKATSEHDLRTGLKEIGFALGFFAPWSTQVAVRFRFSAPLYTLPRINRPALCRIRYEGRKSYHWIVLDGSTVHDPSLESPATVEAYERLMRRSKAYATSYAGVAPGVHA